MTNFYYFDPCFVVTFPLRPKSLEPLEVVHTLYILYIHSYIVQIVLHAQSPAAKVIAYVIPIHVIRETSFTPSVIVCVCNLRNPPKSLSRSSLLSDISYRTSKLANQNQTKSLVPRRPKRFYVNTCQNRPTFFCDTGCPKHKYRNT